MTAAQDKAITDLTAAAAAVSTANTELQAAVAEVAAATAAAPPVVPPVVPPAVPPVVAPVSGAPSPDGQYVTSASGGVLYDYAGNAWQLSTTAVSGGFTPLFNGKPFVGGGGLVMLTKAQGTLWGKNANGLWYYALDFFQWQGGANPFGGTISPPGPLVTAGTVQPAPPANGTTTAPIIVPPTGTSPDGSMTVSTTPVLIDAFGHKWWLSRDTAETGLRVVTDGTEDTHGDAVSITIKAGAIYTINSQGQWYVYAGNFNAGGAWNGPVSAPFSTPVPTPPVTPVVPPAAAVEFFTKTKPSLISTHPCAQGLLWDGIDLGDSVAQLAPGAKVIDWTSNAGSGFPNKQTPVEQTPWGPAMKWSAFNGSGAAIQQAANGFGVIGWLQMIGNNPPQPDATDPIRVASILQGKPAGTGFTVACTYRQAGIGATGNMSPPFIFGKFMNAGEAPTLSQIVSFANWAFVETGSIATDFGDGKGSGKPTVGFAWNANGVPAIIDWPNDLPPPSLGSLVSLVATAVVMPDGTSTVTFWASINAAAPLQIGQVAGQVINNNGNGNNEDQIGWAGILHFTTGNFQCVHWGNVFRGSFNKVVWSNETIAAYCANPDCYHAWQ